MTYHVGGLSILNFFKPAHQPCAHSCSRQWAATVSGLMILPECSNLGRWSGDQTRDPVAKSQLPKPMSDSFTTERTRLGKYIRDQSPAMSALRLNRQYHALKKMAIRQL
ncbi:unnamed protein product [Heterobilharzia americana]|nr:unnamed protein product [Heterobilharzia americana]CAH8659442.1 unnamed protein product [Heterobilharzia americana]